MLTEVAIGTESTLLITVGGVA